MQRNLFNGLTKMKSLRLFSTSTFRSSILVRDINKQAPTSEELAKNPPSRAQLDALFEKATGNGDMIQAEKNLKKSNPVKADQAQTTLREAFGEDYDPNQLLQSLHPETIKQLNLNPEKMQQILDGTFRVPQISPAELSRIDGKTEISAPKTVRRVSETDLEYFRPMFNGGDNGYALVPPLIFIVLVATIYVSYLKIDMYYRKKDAEAIRAARLAEVLALEAAKKAQEEAAAASQNV